MKKIKIAILKWLGIEQIVEPFVTEQEIRRRLETTTLDIIRGAFSKNKTAYIFGREVDIANTQIRYMVESLIEEKIADLQSRALGVVKHHVEQEAIVDEIVSRIMRKQLKRK